MAACSECAGEIQKIEFTAAAGAAAAACEENFHGAICFNAATHLRAPAAGCQSAASAAEAAP